jgi:hypothetical protein
MRRRPDLEAELWTAEQAISMIDQGGLGLPDFQRRFQWTSADVRAFLSTVLAGLPSGTLMIADNRKLRVNLRPLEGAPSLNDTIQKVLVLLDGQQRLTALYHAITDTGPDRYALDATAMLEGADLLQDDVVISAPARSFEKLVRESHVNRRILIPLSALMDSYTFLAWRDNLDTYQSDYVGRETRDRLGDLFADTLASVSSYRMPVTKIGGDLDLSTIAQVFERTNKWGQKLDAFDLLVARLRAGGWSLRDAWEEASDAYPALRKVFPENGLVVMSAIALLEHGDIRRNAILSLSSDLVAEIWDNAVHACNEIALLLIAEGFRRADLIPYDVAASNMIASRMNGLPLEQLKRYIWRVGANRRYEVASNTSVVSDFKAMSRGYEVPELAEPNLSKEAIEANSKRSSRALWATLVAAMLSFKPYDLVTGRLIVPEDGDSAPANSRSDSLTGDPLLRDENWDLTSIIKGGGPFESEFDTPARLRTTGQLLYQRPGGSRLRTGGLRSVVQERSIQPWLLGPTIEDCLGSQLLPRDTTRLLNFKPRDLVRWRAENLWHLLQVRGWQREPGKFAEAQSIGDSVESRQGLILNFLRNHFEHSRSDLEPEEVAAGTGLSLPVARLELSRLSKLGMVRAINVAELEYPVRIVGLA